MQNVFHLYLNKKPTFYQSNSVGTTLEKQQGKNFKRKVPASQKKGFFKVDEVKYFSVTEQEVSP